MEIKTYVIEKPHPRVRVSLYSALDTILSLGSRLTFEATLE